MTHFKSLLLCWIVLVALGAIELASSFLPIAHDMRPLLEMPAIAMAALVALVFMRVRNGPAIIRAFAAASIFWLTILLGLGTMDPLTRAVYPETAIMR